MNKIRVSEVIVVEGKYDAAKLADIVDGLILTTDGFSVFKNNELRELILKLGAKRGLVVLTDSDAAGFKIRKYINDFAQNITVKNAYVPSLKGKESRKDLPSKEGLLGVEGIPIECIIKALKTAGVGEECEKNGRSINYTDLFELGISGGNNSMKKRQALLSQIGLPLRLSKKALCQVLSSLYTYDEFAKICCDC